tara:strand:- start:95 stop:1621 length:1527 start_codon:yes stop_codon:yes gene_type:complete
MNTVLSPSLIFCISLIIHFFCIKYFARYYAFDRPDERKLHGNSKSLIGGLIFSLFFLAIGMLNLELPSWFYIGSLISIILGALDDNFDIKWYYKLLVQVIIYGIITHNYFGQINTITFFDISFSINQFSLMSIYLIWFIGIYNAVNLIDGLDALAGGFMVLLTISLIIIFSESINFLNINLFLCVILLSYIVYNQRPSMVFMGDSGSLFLGYFIAVLPLIHFDTNDSTSNNIDITYFLIISTYLIADTTRVFFTRIFLGKSPMDADTIHLHHLVIQKSGSYITTLFMIFFTSSISFIFAITYSNISFSINVMLIYLSFLFLFVLTPPTPTYVTLIAKIIKPFYRWYKNVNDLDKFEKVRTYFILTLFFLQIAFLIKSLLENAFIPSFQVLIAIILLLLFTKISKDKRINISSLQIFLSILIIESAWDIEVSILSKLIMIFLFITLLVFTLKGIYGTITNYFTALDLLMTILFFGSVAFYILGIDYNIFVFLIVFTSWFSIGFVLRRII